MFNWCRDARRSSSRSWSNRTISSSHSSGTAVDLELRLAHVAAAIEGRVIEVVVTHRALEFPGAWSGEKDDRRMCVDAVDRCTAVCGGRFEKRDDVALILCDHGLARSLSCP